MFRNHQTFALLAILAASITSSASAQTWPSKPVNLQIAYAAGGAMELPLRLILPRVSASLGQQVLMVYRPGGGGTIATDAVIAAGTDGGLSESELKTKVYLTTPMRRLLRQESLSSQRMLNAPIDFYSRVTNR